MSSTAQPPASPDVGSPPAPPAAPARPPRPRRRWGRRLLLVLGALTLLVLVLRLVAWIAVPIALDLIAHRLGLDLQSREVSISLLGGEVELAGVRAVARDGGPRVLEVDYVRGDLALWPLLRGDLVLERVELDGVDVTLDRGLHDEVELLRMIDEALRPLLGPHGPNAAIREARARAEDDLDDLTGADDDGRFELQLPVEVRRLVVRHVRARLRDPLVTPPVDVTADVTLELAGLEVGAKGPLLVELAVDAAPLLRLRASGRARLEHDRLEATLRVAGTGIHAQAVEGWLTAAGVHVRHQELELAVEASILIRPAIDDPRQMAATFALDHLVVRGDGAVVLSADRAELELDRPGEGFICRRLELVGVRGTLVRDPAALAVEISGVRVFLGEDEEDDDDDAPVALHEVVVRDLELTYSDVSVPGGLTLPLRIESLRLRGADSRAPERAGQLAIAASLPGTARAVTVSGAVWLFAPFRGADIDLAARGLTLEGLTPTLLAAGLRPALRDGELTARVRVLLQGEDDGAMTLDAHVERLRLSDGGEDLLTLDLLDAPSAHVDPVAGQVRVEQVLVRGPRVVARRTADGRLHLAGVSLDPAHPAAVEAAVDEVIDDAIDVVDGHDDVANPDWFRWRVQVARLDVSGVSGVLADDAAPGGTPVLLSITEAGLLVQGLDLAPEADVGPPARLAGWVVAPGIVERFAVRGTADASQGRLSVALDVDARGLTLAALRPYLLAAGADTLLEDGRLSAALSAEATVGRDGTFTARAALDRLRFSDGSRRLLLVDDLRAVGLTGRPEPAGPAAYGLERLELRRLDLPVRLGADGSVTLLGLRLDRSSEALDADPDLSEEARDEGLAGPLLRLPHLTLGGIDLARVTVQIEDERRPGDDLQVALELAVGALRFDPAATTPPPATPFALRVLAPGAADLLRLRGGVSLSPDVVRLEALLTGHGLTERLVASIPGLHTEDVSFDRGHLRVRAAGEVRRQGDALGARLDVGPLTLADRTGELLGLDLASVEGALGPAQLRIDDLHIRRPRVSVVRAGPGQVRVAGLLLRRGAVPDVDEPEDAAPAARALPRLQLGRARVTGLEVAWTDLAVAPAIEQVVTLDLVAHDLSTGAGPPGDVRVVVTAPGAVDRLVLGGKVALSPARLAAELALDIQGIHAATLAPYVPGLTLQDGRARATVGVDVSTRDDGGFAARASVRDVEVRDADQVLLAGPGLWLDAANIDPQRLVEVGLVQLEIDVLEITRADGVLTIGGVPVGGPAAAPAPTRPATPEPTPPPTPGEVARIGAPPSSVTRPLFKLGALDVVVHRLRFADLDAGRAVVEGTDLRLRSLGPFETLGPPGRELTAPSFELTGALAPIMRDLRLRVTGDPLVNDPELEVQLELAGLRGQGLTAVAPELIETLDGRGLTDGYLNLGARVKLRTRRSDPLDPSIVSRGFGARVELLGLTLHEGGPRGSLLFGIDWGFADIDWLSPERGRVDVRLLEVYRPRFVVTRFPDGIQVGGLLIKQRPDEPEEEDDEPPATRVHVRQLSLVDVDATFEDRRVSPSFVLPIRGLELDVTGLDTHAGRVPNSPPITFNLLAFSGPVALPPRPERGLRRVTGAVSSVVRLLDGDDRDEAVEHRPLFDEITARGVLETYPDLHGRVRASLRSFEVRGLIGLAAKSGVDVSDGVLDLDVVLDLGPAGEGDVQVGAVIQDLSLTEPRQGPIVRLLQVPVSLDAVLFVLRDDRGVIRLSVDAEVPPDGELERGELLSAVAEAIGEQSLRALRSAPLRVLNPLVWLIDLLTPGDLMGFRDLDLEPMTVVFAPGSSELDRAQRIALELLAERLEKDDELILLLRHELGVQDGGPMERITSPDAAHDRDLIARLAARRAELLWRRSDQEARTRAAFGAGAYAGAQAAIAEIQRIEATLGRIERALAGAEDRVGSRSDRLAERRARTAALALAEARMVEVRETLCAAGLREADRRVRLGPARYVAAAETPRGIVIATPQEELVETEEVPDIRAEGERPELGGP